MTDTFDEYEGMPTEGGGLSGFFDILLTIAGTLALVIFIRLFIAETFEVPSGSMLETIQIDDRLVGEKVPLHWQAPAYGDIVTFLDPDGSGDTLIKRVIATAGQVVDFKEGRVYIDDQLLEESYVLGKPTEPIYIHSSNLAEDISYPYTVPEGCIWVMGDNRLNSLDSRYFGPVPVDQVTSKALFIYWPPSDVSWLK